MTATQPVREAAREAAPWIERAARLGYASIGTVYIVIGLMTAAAAAGLGGKTSSRQDAIVAIGSMPLGTAALMMIGVGLAGYSIWLVCAALFDSDRRGADAKGLAIRAGNLFSAVAHAFIAFSVFRFAHTHLTDGSGGDQQAKMWTARVMDLPLGRWAVAVAGLVLVGIGVYQLSVAFRAKLSRRLHIEHLRRWNLVVAICQFGIAARGVIIGVIGISLVSAALRHDASKTAATKGALQNVAAAPYGGALLILVSLGIVAYGFYELVKAKYRAISAT